MVFIFFLQNNRGQFSPPLFLFLFQIISTAKSGFICPMYGCLYIQPTRAIRNCIIPNEEPTEGENWGAVEGDLTVGNEPKEDTTFFTQI